MPAAYGGAEITRSWSRCCLWSIVDCTPGTNGCLVCCSSVSSSVDRSSTNNKTYIADRGCFSEKSIFIPCYLLKLY